MDVRALLSSKGLLTKAVDAWLRKQFVRTVDELAYFFITNDEILNEAPFMADAWISAVANKSHTYELHARMLRMLNEVRQASEMCLPPPPPRPRRKRLHKPRTQGPTDNKAKDVAARASAAELALQLSFSWAPSRGLAKGISPGDKILLVLREVKLNSLIGFEPQGVLRAVRECYVRGIPP